MSAPITARQVLLAGSLIMFLSLGARQGFGLFMLPAMVDMDMTREQFSVAVATQYLVWGIASPLFGLASDRWGSGKVLFAGGVLYAAGFLASAYAESFIQFWCAAGVLLGLGLGATSFGVVHAAVARATLSERRGVTLGWVGAATALGQLTMLLFTHVAIERLGWRNALLGHAAAVVLIAGAARYMRSGTDENCAQARRAPTPIDAFAKQPVFWLIAIPFGFSGFQVMATMTHLPALIADEGWNPNWSVAVLTAVSLSAFVGSYLFGRLADHWSPQQVLGLIYGCRAVLALMLATVSMSRIGLLLYFLTVGLFWMSPITVASSLTASWFGSVRLSFIFGLVFAVHQIGGFLGTWIAAAIREFSGSYDTVWLSCAVLCALGSAASFRISAYTPGKLLSVARPKKIRESA